VFVLVCPPRSLTSKVTREALETWSNLLKPSKLGIRVNRVDNYTTIFKFASGPHQRADPTTGDRNKNRSSLISSSCRTGLHPTVGVRPEGPDGQWHGCKINDSSDLRACSPEITSWGNQRLTITATRPPDLDGLQGNKTHDEPASPQPIVYACVSGADMVNAARAPGRTQKQTLETGIPRKTIARTIGHANTSAVRDL
jgi:hypothetical protein